MALVQQRRGTAADLASANEKPLAGQIFFEIDTNRMKVGDGIDFYNDLDYITNGTTIADLDGLQVALDANSAAAATAQATADSKATVASVQAVDTHVNNLDSAFAQHKSRHSITGTDPLSPADIGAAPDALVGEVNTLESDLSLARLDLNNVITISSQNSVDLGNKADKVANNTFIGTQNFSNAVSFRPNDINLQALAGGSATNGQYLAWSGYSWSPTTVTPASIGAQPAGMYATLVNGTVPAAQLPSYVDDVIETSGTPTGTGETGKIYVDTTTNAQYRWSGAAWIPLVSSPGSTDAVPEGSTNLYFTDARAVIALSSELAAKADTAGDTFTGDVTVGDGTAQSSLRFPAASSQFDTNATDFDYVSLYNSGGDVAGLGVTTSNFNLGTAGAINLSVYAQGTLSERHTGAYTRCYVSQYYNGRAFYAQGAAATNPTISVEGDSDTGIYFPTGGNQIAFSTGGSERVKIHSTGITLPNAYTNETGGVYGYYSQISKSATNSGGTFAFLAGGNAPSQFNGSVYVTAGSSSAPSIANRSTTNTGVDFQGTSVSVVVSGNNRIQADASGCYLFGNVSVMDGLALTQLQDGGASVNDVLTWSGTAWTPTASGGGGGSTTLGGLTDVTVTSPAVNQVLFYGPSGWVNSSLNTGVIAESGNLYYTDARAEAAARGIVGTAAGALCAGNDPRLSDARTPTAHTHAQSDITNLTTDLSNKVDTTDARLSDARTPTAHTHPQSDITNLTTDLAAKVGSDTTQAGGGTAVNNIVVMSQQDYNNLVSPDSNTVYFLT